MDTQESSQHSSPAESLAFDSASPANGHRTCETPSEWFGLQGRSARNGFLLFNAWLALHVFSIIIFPASVEPSSPLLQSCSDSIAWYMQTLFLDHGFDFFTPEPGASTLVDYTLEFADGTSKTGRFPNRTIFPRLFYHRHFMLSEFLGNGPEDLQPLVERAFARNLCRANNAIRVKLTKIEHELATIENIRAGLTLNDPSLFKESPLGTYTSEELAMPYKPKSDNADADPASESASKSADEPKESP